jgi:hypothetical protein
LPQAASLFYLAGATHDNFIPEQTLRDLTSHSFAIQSASFVALAHPKMKPIELRMNGWLNL